MSRAAFDLWDRVREQKWHDQWKVPGKKEGDFNLRTREVFDVPAVIKIIEGLRMRRPVQLLNDVLLIYGVDAGVSTIEVSKALKQLYAEDPGWLDEMKRDIGVLVYSRE